MSHDDSGLRTITQGELKRRNRREDPWLAISGRVYAVKDFMSQHPGGAEVLFEKAGKDATQDFIDIGHSKNAQELLKKYCIGKLEGARLLTEDESPKQGGEGSKYGLSKTLTAWMPTTWMPATWLPTTHVDAHQPDASSRPREDGESRALATLVYGFTDIRAEEKNTAIKALEKKGYLSMYDVAPDTIEKLSITEGAKKAMVRQLKAAQNDTVPTGEKQIISAKEISAMDAYVSEGIKKKEFSWDVPLPGSKPLIDTDDQSYTWNAPDTSKWNASQVVEVVYATKLQYGLLSGVADPSKTLLHAPHPALCLKGADGWRDVVLRPDRTFEKSVAAFSGSTYKKTFERTSKSMSVAGSVFFGLFSAHVKRTLDSQKGSIRKNEEFSIVTKVSCYGCEVNLANHLAIRPEVENEFAAVCDDPEMNSIQKRAKIHGLFEKYGAFYVRRCKLGVQATGANTLTSKFSFNAEELASTLEAGCSFSFFAGAGAAKRGFSGSSELQETAREVSEHLNVEVIGATIAPGPKFLSSIAPSAGDPRQWAVLDISEIVPIAELFDPVLQKKVNDLDEQPWGCKVVQKMSDRTRNPSVTIGAADIEKQLGKGYTVISGGACVGVQPPDLFLRCYLTESRPTYDAKNRITGWIAATKHYGPTTDVAVTAYAICLKPNDPAIILDAKVATATDGPTRHGSIELAQHQAQQQHPGYTLVSGGGGAHGRVLTASLPTGNEASVDGWEVKARDHPTSEATESGNRKTVVYGVMLKNIAGFHYRVKRHSSVSAVAGSMAVASCREDRPELSTTQLVCGGGATTFERTPCLTRSAPILDRATGAPIGWAAECTYLAQRWDTVPGSVEAYTVYLDGVPSV